MKTRNPAVVLTIILALSLAAPWWSKKKQEETEATSETPAPTAQVKKSFPFGENDLFFVEPYTYLDPPENGLLGMSLELDYAEIRFPFGFINTLEPGQPPVNFKKRILVTDKDQLQRISEQSGFKTGDQVTAVFGGGVSRKANIVSFSYVGNSPSTVVVAADLKLEGETRAGFFQGPAVAIRGVHSISETPVMRKESPAETNPLYGELVNLCSGSLGPGYEVYDREVIPAVIDAGAPPYYFVSFWKRPAENFEIDDIMLETCLFQQAGGTWTRTTSPFPFRFVQAYDLDSDGDGEILALSGDALELCYVYMAPFEEGYRTIKKGLCSGY